MRTNISILIILIIIFNSCQLEKKNNTTNTIPKEKIQEAIQVKDDSTFFKAVKELEKIHFVLEGKDSVVVTTNPLDLIELNSIKQVFYNPFDSTDTGLEKYKKVDLLKKCHIKKKKSNKKIPSANIVQLNFKNSQDAQNWFDTYDKNPYKTMIENKPLTTVWLDNNKIYFIQTYNTRNRESINLIKSSLIKKLN